jgi:low molecular weight protein-tyrosine phosphatase
MADILVICTGNVCRSPMAEGFLRRSLQRRLGTDAPSVSSAGTTGWEGRPAMPESIEAAAEREIDIARHVARALERGQVERAGLLVGMAAEHRDAVARSLPEAAARAFTLKELVRLLEALPARNRLSADDLPRRVAEAEALRRSGFPGNAHDEDVVDPLGMPLQSYRAIAWELDQWNERLVTGLFGPPAGGTSEVPGGDRAREAAP